MSAKSEKQAERASAIEKLRKFLKPGDNVTTTVLHVSRSGMSRSIRCQAIRHDDDGKPFISDISYLVALAIGARIDDSGGVVIGGCGFDATFEVVYSLGRVLFPDGFGIAGKTRGGGRCVPKDKAQAERMVKAGCKFRGRNGDESGWDNDGGYALNRMR